MLAHEEKVLAGGRDCGPETTAANAEELDEWLEETVWHGLRMWHVIFLSIGIALSFIILLCCCIKVRIPRTKQEIEGDYIRRRIMRKFRKRLKAIQNQELDEMDLKKALDKIRTELKSDTESLQQSDVLSGATLSSAGAHGAQGSTYRRASQIQIDISLEDLRIQSLGMGARITLAISRLFRRNPSPRTQGNTEDDPAAVHSLHEGDKPTAALLPCPKDSEKDNTLSHKKSKLQKTPPGGKPQASDTKVTTEDEKSTMTSKKSKTEKNKKVPEAKDNGKESTNNLPSENISTITPSTSKSKAKESGQKNDINK